MGYGYYEIDGMKRGYGVSCKCHKRGCQAKIHRGITYLCYLCTWYFCDEHLTMAFDSDDCGVEVECFAGESGQVCYKCAKELEETAM